MIKVLNKATGNALDQWFSNLSEVSNPTGVMQAYIERTFSIYACLRRKDDCYQIGLKLWKNCIHQTQR